MNDIAFVDTTIRDGDQSLWGFRMTTGMILPVASSFEEAGFEAIEAESWSTFKIRVRQLHEEPWDRLRLLKKRITRTPFSMVGGINIGGFNRVPFAIRKLCYETIAAKGVNRVQMIGFLNDLSFLVPEMVQIARGVGLQVVLGLVYTTSPKHTDEYYAQKTRDAVKLKPDRVYLKDPGGLLTPERTRTIIPAVQQNSGGLPVELHSHCTTGLAPLCYLEAIKLGIKTLHTGIAPLANGAAQPSVLNIARNARLLGYYPAVSEKAVKPISDHFLSVARRERLPIGAPLEYDYGQYLHQIPGGVISNLKRQLAEMNKEHLLPAVMEETVQVRKDLGYPIMVTPFSQHVVTQGTINVMLGRRYEQVSDELIQYCLGYWGQEASSGVDVAARDKILDRPRARELAKPEHVELSIKDIRRKLGGPGVSDDELLMRYILGGDEDLKAMRPAPPIREYQTTGNPLMALVSELAARKGLYQIRLEERGLSLVLQRDSRKRFEKEER